MPPYERLSVSDRLFLDMETDEANLHVASCFLFDASPLRTETGGIDFDRINDYVASRLHRIPRYRQRLHYVPVEGDPVWVDDPTFNLNYHIRHTHLPLPGDARQLKRLCGRIVSQLLDRGKPLWEMWIVDGLEGDRFAIITKIHHCMIDGVGGVDLAGNLFSMQPTKDFEEGPLWLPRPVPTSQQLVRDAISRRLSAPREILGGLARSARDSQASIETLKKNWTGLREMGEYTTSPASATPINEPIGPHRRFDWMSMDLASLREIKARFDGTVNDVALAIITGAFSRFLERRGIDLRRQAKLDFRASCPVNIRTKEEAGDLGNRVSNLIVKLPLSERNPEKRLKKISETMNELKSSNQARAMSVIERIGEYTHPSLLTYFARLNVEQQSSNFVLTNVPGPRDPWYLLESQLLAAYPVVPLMQRHGVGIAAMSYAGVLYWGFNSDWDQVPDLHELILANEESFQELLEAARDSGIGESSTKHASPVAQLPVREQA
jgi:diacylglycerol O-acyltransferase